jgi:hypothetical protein
LNPGGQDGTNWQRRREHDGRDERLEKGGRLAGRRRGEEEGDDDGGGEM